MVIRKGKSGHFCDKALEGVSHHAIVPNVNVLDDLEARIARLTDDEKRLFALICRSYLAAMMPDFEYRQTTALLDVPVDGKPVRFRAVGRVPVKLGWKAVYGLQEPDPDAKDKDEDASQILPPLTDGETAALSDPRVEAKRTQPPPRYSEGTLIDAMQNAWRFVEDAALRDRLKEAKGIGTPATRAEVIKGLKRQNLLTNQGKMLVPTDAGISLYELLRDAAPPLVDPGTTAVWEMRLDDILRGAADFRAVIDAIATEAERLIGVLANGQRRGIIALETVVPPKGKGRGAATAKAIKARGGRRRSAAKAVAAEDGAAPSTPARTTRSRHPKAAAPANTPAPASARRNPPTDKMLAFARSLATRKGIELPDGVDSDFDACRQFLDSHASSVRNDRRLG